MDTRKEDPTIEELLALRKVKALTTNHEYQRGKVWGEDQKKLFIDSVLREYPIPLVYLHEKEIAIPMGSVEHTNRNYEIIDGQQRIETLYEYFEGAFELFDPNNDEKTRFPNFMKQKNCDWGGKRFTELSDEYKKIIRETKIPTVFITSKDDNEVRDLFIRLQAGLPLNPQEKRDAWPGGFTDFILEIGGKPEIAKYPGHNFFPKVMGQTSDRRGRTRELAAYLYMSYDYYHQYQRFVDLKNKFIDDFYRLHIDFDREEDRAKRFCKILKIIEEVYQGKNLPRLEAHLAHHLVVFVDSIMDNYTPNWKEGLGGALEKFQKSLAEARTIQDDKEKLQNEYYVQYGMHIRGGSNNHDTIQHRHIFFLEKIGEFMKEGGYLNAKDPRRGFDRIEREYVFFRDNKTCLMCDKNVVWSEVEVHHVEPHSEGGKTDLSNAALVHRACHPKSAKDVEVARQKFKNKDKRGNILREKEQRRRTTKKNIDLPEGTQARMYKSGKMYTAEIIKGGKWKVGEVVVNSPSAAAAEAFRQDTGRIQSFNGYDVWEVKRPQDENWRTLQSLRVEE